MPDLSGEASGSTYEVAVNDDGAAHTSSQRHHEYVGLTSPRAEASLGPAGRVGVILDDDGQAHTLGDDVTDLDARPVQIGTRGHGVAVRGDEAGRADAHGRGLRVSKLEVESNLDDRGEDGVTVVGRRVLLHAGDDVAILVHDSRGDLRTADVHADAQ